MTKVAYARTSTVDQSGSLETQIARFKALGVDPDLIFAERCRESSICRTELPLFGCPPIVKPRTLAAFAWPDFAYACGLQSGEPKWNGGGAPSFL